MRRLAASADTRAELGERLRKRQRDSFTVAVHVDLLEREYRRVTQFEQIGPRAS
jgi:hypothetical protein